MSNGTKDNSGSNQFWNEDYWRKEAQLKEGDPGAGAQGRKEKDKGYFYGGLVAGMAVSLFIICVVFLAVHVDRWVNGVETSKNSPALSDGGVQEKIDTIEEMIRYYYYRDEDIDDEAMQEGIYKGILRSLGDPYSEYYTKQELADLMDQTQGIYYGIGAGIQLDTATSYPKIVKVYDGTPAQEAGLREEDIVFEVDGVSTYGMSTTDVVALIKGEDGTYVNLTIVRDGVDDYMSFDVQRRQVDIPTVEFRMLDEQKAYIQITEFDDITVQQFADALAKARENGMDGLILDLRSNPGGSLDAVVRIAQMILPEGMIVYTENKYGYREEYTCDGKHELEVPLVVLVNGNSASASEILAGAIKDYGIGTLVGTTTYGKGIVQSIIPLEDESAVKVTVSSYYTPNGNNIHGIGIEPDVECVFDGEAYYGDDSHPDNQLDAASQVLEEMLGN